ncbi:MAG: HAD family hydrolase [Bacteroidales bacterium]
MKENCIEEIKQSFLDNKDECWIFRKPKGKITNFFFDFDGVLLKECSIHESAYAWMIHSIKFNLFDIDYKPDSIEVSEANELRKILKGKSPKDKLDYMIHAFSKIGDLNLSYSDLNTKWMMFLRNYIIELYGKNPRDYLMGGSEDFLKECRTKGNCYGLTANFQPQAEWLMGFVGLVSCFNRVYGYDLNEVQKASKGLTLQAVISEKNLRSENVCMIGDGVPDIQAGKDNKSYTIAVGNTLENSIRVMNADPDVLITSFQNYSVVRRLISLL